jgi:hypothetical protein
MARLTFKLAKDYGKTPWTIPEFGKHYYNLGRSTAYAAAARGDIPVIRIGGKLLGLPRVAEAQLSQTDKTIDVWSNELLPPGRRVEIPAVCTKLKTTRPSVGADDGFPRPRIERLGD